MQSTAPDPAQNRTPARDIRGMFHDVRDFDIYFVDVDMMEGTAVLRRFQTSQVLPLTDLCNLSSTDSQREMFDRVRNAIRTLPTLLRGHVNFRLEFHGALGPSDRVIGPINDYVAGERRSDDMELRMAWNELTRIMFKAFLIR